MNDNNDATPTREIDDLPLTDEQKHALNIIAHILEGKYNIVGTNADDLSQVGICEPARPELVKPFRITEDGKVVGQTMHPGMEKPEDVKGINPIDPWAFATLTLSYSTAIVTVEDPTPTQDQEFVQIAYLAVDRFKDSLGDELTIGVIRSGAIQRGLLPKDAEAIDLNSILGGN